MRRWTAIALGLGLQAAAVLAYFAVEGTRAAPFRFEEVDRAAPELELIRPDGSRFHLSHLRGKRVLLHFWGTWCPPCREELPVLEMLERDLKEDGIVLLAVSLDPEWETIRRFVGRDLPPMIVRSGSIAIDRYGLSTLPDTFVLDAEGRMTMRIRGARDWRSAEARWTIARSPE